jgi:EAL domain-containing protein (putative c-di-GMP-specific phosphodiesterase class I)
VILITGVPDIASAARAVEYGAFRYMTKPVEADVLERSVRRAARAHAMARLRRDALAISGAHASAADRAGLEVRFDQALEGAHMAFQPIVEASSGAAFGIEALLRSSEPSMATPQVLLQAAEQLGRLPLLGRRVRGLCAAAVGSLPEHLTMFVNLHPADLDDAHLVDPASPLTAVAGRVVLEVTERDSLDGGERLERRLARLRELGFRLAVDDIGAGYSGLRSFTDLQPEFVKIDVALVRDVDQSELKQRTIAALCRLCHDIGCAVVGEGVETQDERQTLVDLGCDLIQGYLIARPSPQLPRG